MQKARINQICRTCFAGLLLLVTVSAASSQAGVEVQALRVDGNSVKQVDGVQIRQKTEAPQAPKMLKVGDALAAETELIVPPRTAIVLISRHGNRITLNAGARFRVGIVSDKGEEHSALAGDAQFSIKNALDFYHVGYRKFLAAVKGTEYTIRIAEGREIEFAVAEGAVEVEQTGKVRVRDGEKSREADGVRLAEVVAAGNVKAYPLSVSAYIREFNTLADAESYYREALAAAIASKDTKAIRRAKTNLGILLNTLSQPREAIVLFGDVLKLARELTGANARRGIAVAHFHLGNSYMRNSEFARAKAEYETGLSLLRDQPQPAEAVLVVSILNALGLVNQETSQYDAALQWFADATVRLGDVDEKDRAEIRAMISNNIGLIYFNRSEYSKALAQFEIAYSVSVGDGDTGDRRLSDHYGIVLNLGNSAQAAGQTEKAIQYYEQALSMAKRLYGERDQEDVANLLNNLASVYDARSEYTMSAEYYEKSLAILRRLYGERDHQSVVRAMNGLALSYMRQSQLDKAVSSLEPAIAMSKRVYGDKDQASLAILQTNLGFAHVSLGNYVKAIPALEDAEALLKRIHNDSPNATSVIVLANLATAYSSAGNPTRGVSAGEASVAMARGVYGAGDHSARAQAEVSLGLALIASGKPAAARELLLAATEMQARLFEGKENLAQVQALSVLAQTEILLGSAKAATIPLERAAAIATRLFAGKDNFLLATILSRLGTAYSSMGAHTRARETLDRSLEMQRRIFGARDNDQILGTLLQLIGASQGSGDIDSALSRSREAAAMAARLHPSGAHPNTFLTTVMLSGSLAAHGEINEAVALAREVTTLAEKSEINSATLGVVRFAAAAVAFSAANYEDAAKNINGARTIFSGALGGDRNEIGMRLNLMYVGLLRTRGDYVGAGRVAERTAEVAIRLFGEADHPIKVSLLTALAEVDFEKGALASARSRIGEARAMHERLQGKLPHPVHVALLEFEARLAIVLRDLVSAKKLIASANAEASTFAGTTRQLLDSLLNSVSAEFYRNEEDAIRVADLRQLVANERRAFYKSVPHPEFAVALAELAAARAAANEISAAVSLLEEANSVFKMAVSDAPLPSRVTLIESQAKVLQASKRYTEAIAKLDEGMNLQRKFTGDLPSPKLHSLMLALGDCYEASGNNTKAGQVREAALKIERAWLAPR